MLERYSNEKMRDVWSEKHKFDTWLKVIVAVANASHEHGIIESKPIAKRLATITAPTPERVSFHEEQLQHDVAAFLRAVNEGLDDDEISRLLYFGMTSSDLVDTAQSIRILESHSVMVGSFDKLDYQLSKFIDDTKGIDALARTHGQAAERIKFNSRFVRIKEDIDSARSQFDVACCHASVCMLSGPTGRYAVLPEWVETTVAHQLNLTPAFLWVTSSQVLPRRLILDVVIACARVASAIENAALQIRLLSITEIGELSEGFGSTQVGSSSMVHKKNPVYSEKLCGVARCVKASVPAAFDNTPLWWERDISHSSAERIILPNVFEATDYLLSLFETVIENLVVDKGKIKTNLDNATPLIFSHDLLCWLIRHGLQRQFAYCKLRDFMQHYDEEFDESDFIIRFVREFDLDRQDGETNEKEILDIIRRTEYGTI